MERLTPRYFPAADRKGLLANWAIENFTLWFLGPEDKEISSDVLHSLDSTTWKLCCLKKDKKLEVSLLRECPNGPEKAHVGFQLFLVADDGEGLAISEPTQKTFDRDSREVCKVDPWDEIFRKRTVFLPEDTLTLRCHLWRELPKNFLVPTRSSSGIRIRTAFTSFTNTYDVLPDIEEKTSEAKYPSGATMTSKTERNATFHLGFHPFPANTSPGDSLTATLTYNDDNTHGAVVRTRVLVLDVEGRPCPETSGAPVRIHHFSGEVGESWTFDISFNWELVQRSGDKFVDGNGQVTIKHETEITEKHPPVKLGGTTHYARPVKKVGRTLKIDLGAILTEGWSCDLTLVAGGVENDDEAVDEGQVFRVHRALVCARSPVFAAMMERDMAERRSGRVLIPDMDAKTLASFLVYVYCGEMMFAKLSCEELAKLYAASDKYEVLSLKKRCGVLMRQRVTPENAFDVLEFAELHSDAGMRDAAVNMIRQKTKEVLSTEEWSEAMRRRTRSKSSPQDPGPSSASS